MKSLKHIFGLLVMGALIVVAGCNKEENGGKKENLPHPNSTYKACPILAHFGNEKLGIKEINVNNGSLVCCFDKEQRIIKATEAGEEYSFEYEYDLQGRLVKVKSNYKDIFIGYNTYNFIDSIVFYENGATRQQIYFTYSHDTVFTTNIQFGDTTHSILKFSDDLYTTHEEDIEYKTWRKYHWENGNIVSIYDNKGNKYDYQYDNSPNIEKIVYGFAIFPIYDIFSKNNEVKPYKKYIYNNKGLLEMIINIEEDGKEYVLRSYEYIYY